MNPLPEEQYHKHIIIVEPHPDDAFLGMYEFGKKHNIFPNAHLFQVTNGDLDFESKKRNPLLGVQRFKETLAFADEVRLPCRNVHRFGLCDGEVRAVDICDFIDHYLKMLYIEPCDTICYCTSEWDQHRDHRETLAAVDEYFWAKLIRYCIDDPPTEAPFAPQYGEEARVDCEKQKWIDFTRLYPSQAEGLIRTKHPSLEKRMKCELILY